ncbi:MAG: dihydrolipoyl dehydrogenase [Planctomycetota bacterium]
MERFQAVVIGAGPGGYVAAIRLGQLGIKTALVEKGALGGVCLNWGCIPSKAYISAAKVMEHLETAADIGISGGGPATVDMAKLKTWKDGVVKRLTDGIGFLVEKNGVTIVRGEARFLDAHTLAVKGEKGETKLGFDQAVIATGSRSTEIPPFPFDGEKVLSSRHMLALTELPEELVVIGGGVIGLEMGMYMSRFGSKVTVVEMMPQVLPGTDGAVVKTLSRVLKKRGITVHVETKALGFAKGKSKLEVEVEDKKGKRIKIPADRILVSIGRRPNVEGLGLEGVGVALGERGFVRVDDQLRTSVPHIFAIGDVAGGALLAHKASKEGLVAAAVIAGRNERYDVRAMPSAVFTEPEIATVGLSEEQAVAAGHEVRIGNFPFTALGKAVATRETEGFVKIVADKTSDRILGVHIIGHEASNLISEAAVAIEAGLTAEDLALTVHPHPTMGESLMEAAEAVHGHAVHIFNP